MTSIRTYHIHLQGQVQGVGFRPFVYQLALEHGLNGWVNNTLDGVHIEITAEAGAADRFFEEVQSRAPVLSRIVLARMEEKPLQDYPNFRIIHSAEAGEATLLLTPDVALCADCRRELLDPRDRRYGYPFITCTNCGPRYSIITRLPYDRPYTTMQPFPMCGPCAAEYDNPLDRRYYSQTNSCETCGIALQWYEREQGLKTGTAAALIAQTAAHLRAGKIVALKGIGGFLLCCDAANEAAIRTLRERKHRPSKPFALMYPSLAALEADAVVRAEEADELCGHVSPILLLELKDKPAHALALEAIAPGLSQVGAMLPYAPLYELLMQELNRPIVATSGNLSNAPIVFDNETAVSELAQIADAVLLHNRDIATPQDDSVVRHTPFYRQRIVLRRSRGLAPTFILPELETPRSTVLAMGAMMKSAFALAHKGNLYLSQYLGDLENYDTERSFRLSMDHLLQLFDARPEQVLVDLHPDYYSTRLGEALARQWDVPLHRYQHHEAHFAAVLAENLLLQSKEPVLGVIWDGTGLGSDGQVWGGEFFRYEAGQVQRVGHLAYFPFILGDKMPREPRISALAACHDLPEALPLLESHFSATEWGVYQTLLQKPAALHTSSIGRLFDAAAALLGLASRSSYEGEAAMLLENAALQYFKKYGLNQLHSIWDAPEDLYQMPPSRILADLVEGLKSKVAIPELAARFHALLVDWIAAVARHQGARHIAFSGGVFQNALLADLCIERLSSEFSLHFHRQLSPNDEGIAFGQTVLWGIRGGS